MKPKNLLKSGFIVLLAYTVIHFTLEFLLKHPIAFKESVKTGSFLFFSTPKQQPTLSLDPFTKV